jgi:ABC-2 type transport system ATP-binding protein
MSTILETRKINKSYANHQALKNLDIAVPAGSIFGLLGPNGAGKTTLIRIINQIIAPDSGEIIVDGEPLKPSHIEIIGYLPEERGLYKKMKVGEQVLYFARLKGLSRSDAMEKIKVWFTKWDIKDWWNKKVEDLSKGMAQKIQFIATVIHEPKLIILDEPFSGFDPINANLIRDEILELREKGSTIIFSTHRMESVEEICDHVALINKAEKILDGPKSQIKEEFRTNTFILEHKGSIGLANGSYTIEASSDIEHGLIRSVLKLKSGTPNEMLRELIQQTEIHSFVEQIPSMNDIFITKVKSVNE